MQNNTQNPISKRTRSLSKALKTSRQSIPLKQEDIQIKILYSEDYSHLKQEFSDDSNMLSYQTPSTKTSSGIKKKEQKGKLGKKKGKIVQNGLFPKIENYDQNFTADTLMKVNFVKQEEGEEEEDDSPIIIGSKKKKIFHTKPRNYWLHTEDIKLMGLIEKHGEKWSKIASLMKGRTGKQVRDRYINYLRPNIKQKDWSQEEDDLLQKLYDEFGNKWSKIAVFLHGRTENQVKNRFYAAARKEKRKREKRNKMCKAEPDLIKLVKRDPEIEKKALLSLKTEMTSDTTVKSNENTSTLNIKTEFNFKKEVPQFPPFGVPFGNMNQPMCIEQFPIMNPRIAQMAQAVYQQNEKKNAQNIQNSKTENFKFDKYCNISVNIPAMSFSSWSDSLPEYFNSAANEEYNQFLKFRNPEFQNYFLNRGQSDLSMEMKLEPGNDRFFHIKHEV